MVGITTRTSPGSPPERGHEQEHVAPDRLGQQGRTYLKFVLRLSWSLHQMLRVLQLNLFDRRPLAELFTTPSPPGSPDPQMLLWC